MWSGAVEQVGQTGYRSLSIALNEISAGGRTDRWGNVAKPKTVLWEADEHTLAKHQILRAYLEAWIPIMSRWNDRLLLIDGFAGPGRYDGGEEGSPLIMLRTLLNHRNFVTNRRTTFSFLFIEQDHDQRRDRATGLVTGQRASDPAG